MNKEIVEKAISKAIDGGWQPPQGSGLFSVHINEGHEDRVVFLEHRRHPKGLPLTDIVYSHDFAKALWGTSDDKTYEICGKDHEVDGDCGDYDCRDYVYRDGWQYHLQQMVVADDPIKYLGDNL